MSKLGIIAAKGNLSQKLVDSVQNKYDLFIVALNGETNPALLENIDHIWINLGEIGKAITALKEAKVDKLVFAGSLKKPDIFSLKVDALGAKLLAKILKNKFFGDDKLLSVLTIFLEEQNLKVVGVHEILEDLVVDKAIFTDLHPNKQDKIDIELARKVVTELGKLDIGQGAIVQEGVVLGVEAIEGTDNLIKRCGEIKISSNRGGVLVKLSKPGQELRMDLPTIGIETIKNIHQSGFKGIVIEAKKGIFLNREEAIEYANKHELFIVSE
ncbi:MAG: UDP-2,3-diacylglucosamine diphosphatase LpxI [Rickettsiales bacterium]